MNQIEHIMALAKEYRDAIIEDGLKRKALRDAIEQALAVQPKQEPVAWMHVQGNYQEPSPRQLDSYELERGWKQYPLYTAPQPQPEKRPQNCGTGFCSCIECPYSDHFPDARKMMEPFGYFRSTLDGWEDCAETDEGAKPLYEAPRPQHEQDNDLLTIAYMAGFDAGKKTAPQPDHFADAGKPIEREWVDLPPEEIKALANLPGADRERTAVEMAYAVQAKLREKNT